MVWLTLRLAIQSSAVLVLSGYGDSSVGVCPAVRAGQGFAAMLRTADSAFQVQQCAVSEPGFQTAVKGSKLLDIVFLVERPIAFNKRKLDYVIDGLNTIMQRSKNDRYSDFQVHYAVMMYSLQHPSTSVFFQDFSSLPDLLYLPVDTVQDVESAVKLDGRVGEWQTVHRALQMVNKVVTKEEFVHENGSMVRLHTRPNADLHIVVVTGLQDTQVTSELASQAESIKKELKSIKSDIRGQLAHLVSSLQFIDNIALHFFIDSSSEPSTTCIGNPSHTVRYKDCTHFNKALTLKAVLSAEDMLADSLQAHMLARGIEAQVADLTDLENSDCTLAINPANWNSFGVHPTFPDRCDLESHHSCPSGFYCSPFHGCVRKETSRASGKSSLPEGIFEGKAPLVPDFSLSHADLVQPRKEDEHLEPTLSLPHEELSIVASRQAHAPPFSLGDVVASSPDTLLWDTDTPFVQGLVANREPVVLKNTVVTTWPAIAKWNFSYLSESIGHDTLDAVKSSNSFVTFDSDMRTPLKLNITLPFTIANMSTYTFFDCIQFPDHCPDGFKGHYYFSKLPESLQSDVKPDHLLYNTERDYLAQRQFMWVSSAGMITHGHFDQDFNFFIQVVGEKRFTLWSSMQHDLMSVFPRVHPMWHKSRVNFGAPDVQRFPQFAKSRAVQVTVTPGDILFIPPYTWHYVETLTPSVSLSTWSHDYYLYQHMNAIYLHDHKFDLLDDPRGGSPYGDQYESTSMHT